MTTLPTDRGYVVIQKNRDGTINLELYHARSDMAGEPFAVYSNFPPRIALRTSARLIAKGSMERSDRPVEVSWSQSEDVIYIH